MKLGNVSLFNPSIFYLHLAIALPRPLAHGAEGKVPSTLIERGKVCSNHLQQRIEFVCNFFHLASFCSADRGDIMLLNLIIVPSFIDLIYLFLFNHLVCIDAHAP